MRDVRTAYPDVLSTAGVDRLSEIVSRCFFLASTNCTFNLTNIRSFLKAWKIVSKDYANYKTYFLKAIESKFANSVVSSNQTSDSDDLPF